MTALTMMFLAAVVEHDNAQALDGNEVIADFDAEPILDMAIAAMVRIPVKTATDSDSKPPPIPIQSRPLIPDKTASGMSRNFSFMRPLS